MIELGRISIKNTAAIVEARNKIRALAQDLKFSPVEATRLATVCSEIGRHLAATGQESDIKVALDKRNGTPGLSLLFAAGKAGLRADAAALEKVFDRVKLSKTARGVKSIEAFKFLPDPEFNPSNEFIGRAREMVGRPTREQLTEQLKEKVIELEQANIALEEASRHKSRFLAGVSHELRTPLNAIIGFSELLLDGVPGEINEEQREFLSDILTGGQHLLNLINDILDLSKVEAGKMEFELEALDLSEAITEAVETIRPALDDKKHHLEVSIEPGLPPVCADRNRLRQVLLNLLSNAIKFTPPGGEIGIEAVREGDCCRVSVVDNGIGIRKKDQARIFEAFVQAKAPNGQETPGTGLGLTLCRQFVQRMGGRIWVESKYGKGSRFSFTLPLALEGEPQPAKK
ncbi:MAG TPA: hypothetical protein G4O01_01035 [Dehalococcoidia bacterium]|jgi:signal transduction histidine kinase|nr:hypothetical protein [Dehalococcoidia bacterium]